MMAASTNAMSMRRKQNKPRVSFADPSCCTTDIELAPPLQRLEEAGGSQTDLWYSQHEMKAIQNEHLWDCHRLRNDSIPRILAMRQRQDIPDHKSPCVLLAADSESRGLEPLVCPERRRRKRLSIYVVLAQQERLRKMSSQHQNQHVPSDDQAQQLAHLSQQCTVWASMLAREEGARDVRRAYMPSSAVDVNQEWRCKRSRAEEPLPVAPDSPTKDSASSFERRVRPTTAVDHEVAACILTTTVSLCVCSETRTEINVSNRENESSSVTAGLNNSSVRRWHTAYP